jgi:hypothetical protein
MSKVSRQLPLTEMLHVPGAVPLEPMDAPAGRPADAIHVGSHDQDGEDIAQPPYQIASEFPTVVILDKPQQTAVADAPNDHTSMYARAVHYQGSGIVVRRLDQQRAEPGLRRFAGGAAVPRHRHGGRQIEGGSLVIWSLVADGCDLAHPRSESRRPQPLLVK